MLLSKSAHKGFFKSTIMVFPFIRVISVMLLLSGMVGLLRIFPPTVFVANLTPLNMLSVALMEVSQLEDTMTNEI